jgi:hypothetical protein
MKKLLALIIALSLPMNSYAAECSAPVRLLEEGSPAQCRGYLFSPEKELQVRMMTKDYDLLQKEVTSLNGIVERLQKKDQESDKILELEAQKTELWKARAEDITLKYVSVEENRGKRDFLFILMGVGLTVLSAWAVGQAAPGR